MKDIIIEAGKFYLAKYENGKSKRYIDYILDNSNSEYLVITANTSTININTYRFKKCELIDKCIFYKEISPLELKIIYKREVDIIISELKNEDK